MIKPGMSIVVKTCTVHILRYLHPSIIMKTQCWMVNSNPSIYQWYLPVFTSQENTLEVANTGKYWSTKSSHLEITTDTEFSLGF